jgi:hypothetical protein
MLEKVTTQVCRSAAGTREDMEAVGSAGEHGLGWCL